MAKLSEEMLAKYYDGELSDKQSKWLEKQLEQSPEYKETLSKMNRMSHLLRLMHEESSSDVSFDGFSERVLTEIKRDDRPGFIERLKVWAEEFFEHRQRIWVPTAAVVTAALAVLLIIPLSDGDSSAPTLRSSRTHAGGQDVVLYTGGVKTAYSSAIESVAHGKTDVEQYKLNYGDESEVGVVWIRE